ncbi:hypothetical protein RFI_22317 [Reticulomyxa filosa]|uniref:Uncharacterized protein n=1 Tax=Reticulomyxa filosa TaxID=46433 RepID=X6MM06_RETFI|nr:hypothetical protein RFI_22317 [Reticulomyxa filosa]|eukprot:ETO15048.1 hypothetical protein RFI_22317 [Reticulomyxa filosa]
MHVVLADNVPACKWLLSSLSRRPGLVSEYLLKTNDNAVMSGFSELLNNAFRVLQPFEEKDLLKTELITRTIKLKFGIQKKEVQQVVSVTCSAQMIGCLALLLRNASNYWFNFRHFFNTFRDFAKMGPYQRTLLVKKQ